MSLDDQNNQKEERKLALLKAVRFLGNQQSLGECLGVNQPEISKLINNHHRSLSFDKVLAIEQATGIPIDTLLPDHPLNTYIEERNKPDKLFLKKIEIQRIILNDLPYLTYPKANRHIIITTDLVLISGLAELTAYKKNNIITAEVIAIDLHSLLLGLDYTKNIINKLLISELIAIGLILEQYLGNRQGQRSDLNTKNNQNSSQLRSNCYEVKGRTKNKISEVLGLKSVESYLRAKKVYLNGSEELSNALDYQKISFIKAANISKLPQDQQAKFIK